MLRMLPFRSLLPLAVAITFFDSAHGQDLKANEGGDVAFGGPGAETGKFAELRDMTFDAQGNLYTLEGAKFDEKTKALTGNLRVQKFSQDGKVLASIDLRDEATGEKLAEKNHPQRLAVDPSGGAWVTQPTAGRVQQFGPDGKWVRSVEAVGATGIAAFGEGAGWRVAVTSGAANPQRIIQTERLALFSSDGAGAGSIALQTGKPLADVRDLAVDREGNFFVQAEPNAIYKFAPDGKLLGMLGGNPTTRSEDGSEVLHTVALDSKGNVYTFTWGNPGLVTRFDADGKTVTQRAGQFKWADPWSGHSGYTILAVDPSDRLWAASTHTQDPKGVHYKIQRASPAIVRTKTDFFEQPAGEIRRRPMHVLGFRPVLKCGLPNNVSYELGQSVPMEVTISAANRFVDSVNGKWRVFDAVKNEIAHGEFALPLKNGEEAKSAFSFTPPRFGAFFVQVAMTSPQGAMGAVGEHVGVTPRWPKMPELGDAKTGGWNDAQRQLWTGLPNMRLHPAGKPDQLDKDLKAATDAGATVIVQLIDNLKKFNADETRALLERFKGRIRFLEVCNEPNFSGGIEDYFKVHKQVYEIAKAIDPAVQVMGPATVNIDLNWLRKLYELGFKDLTDVVSLHDYEGHESVSPEHWQWKFGEARKLMSAQGDPAKAIWQTERAMAGVRGDNFMGLAQAIRTTMHRDLLETLGIPTEHNNHYYLNQGGYSSVPTYVWSNNGPHPAALALRTRHAVTTAVGRRFAGQLDFGPSGRDLLLGVRYAGDDGETVSLRNLGTREMPLDFEVRGATSLDLVDAWGNASPAPVQNGKARLTLAQLPLYVRLPRGAELVAPKLNFGRNVAALAQFSYSTTSGKSDFALLNNGVVETYHAGNPNGDTNGAKIWTGDLPGDVASTPQTLEMRFEAPQTLETVVIRGVRADNAFCALLAYDLQWQDGETWKTIESVKRPMPPSEEARTADASRAIWMDDTNFFVHRFKPVTTSRLRLVVHDVTHGFVPDAVSRAWGNAIPQKLMLREVELYAR